MDSLKDVLHSRGFQVVLGASATVAGLAIANHLYKRRKYSKARQSWDSQPEDVVVLHQVRQYKNVELHPPTPPPHPQDKFLASPLHSLTLFGQI